MPKKLVIITVIKLIGIMIFKDDINILIPYIKNIATIIFFIMLKIAFIIINDMIDYKNYSPDIFFLSSSALSNVNISK